ncbi:Crp/Fnr family transcriptional regulator [Lentzea sp. NPDC004782]|uniref:Crp/Fnr family transcriptional regulator n=1 Tax=Lentzea sp. NPDC004782 TaxID=3154458 RepID=UPI0033B1FE8F
MSQPVAGSLFAHLREEDREAVLAAGRRREFPADQLLFQQGDPSTHVFVLLSGWVRVSAVAKGGGDLLLAFRGPGDAVGELAAVQDIERVASVRTVEEVTAVQLRREQFVGLLSTRPAVAMGMINQLAARVVGATHLRAAFATLDTTQRVAACLVRLMDQHGVPAENGVVLRIRVSQQDVASQVDASLRSVARAFGVLRARGIVISERARVLIREPGMLRRFAGDQPNGR